LIFSLFFPVLEQQIDNLLRFVFRAPGMARSAFTGAVSVTVVVTE
jgi:hypothetical protein